MSNGTVQNRFITSDVADSELERIHNLLDDVAEGRTLGDLREFFARKLATERVQHDELRRRAFVLGGAVMKSASETGADVVIEGEAGLYGQPEFSEANGLRQVVAALGERDRIVELLDATFAANGTAVVVGSEAGELGGGQLALVGASYTDHGRTAGSVAVIGPTRMDYPKVVPLVAATAMAMSEYMDRNDVRKPENDE